MSDSAQPHRSRLGAPPSIRSLLLATTVLLSGCGMPAGVDPDACGDNVRVSVSAGLTPTVSWASGCTIGTLYIDSAPAGPSGQRGEAHFVWFLNSPLSDKGARTNLISGPVSYSSRPAGVTVEVEPRPLVSGIRYRVTLVSYPLLYPTDGHLEINSLDFIP
jgi:hypothetical protein